MEEVNSPDLAAKFGFFAVWGIDKWWWMIRSLVQVAGISLTVIKRADRSLSTHQSRIGDSFGLMLQTPQQTTFCSVGTPNSKVYMIQIICIQTCNNANTIHIITHVVIDDPAFHHILLYSSKNIKISRQWQSLLNLLIDNYRNKCTDIVNQNWTK